MRALKTLALASLILAACAPPPPTTSPTFTGSASSPVQERAEQQNLRLALNSLPANLTPASGFANTLVYSTIYDTVTVFGKDFAVNPGVADRWDLSSDGLMWTFSIRQGLTFSNNDPVTAQDVAFSINETLARAWPNRSFIATATEAKAVNATSVEVKTRAPDMSLPSGMGFLFVLPEKYYKAQGGFDGFRDKPIGSGPYTVTEYLPDGRAVFKKRSGEHPYRTPIATEITMLSIPDHSQKINGLRTGDIDFVPPVAATSDQAETAAKDGLKLSLQRNAFIFLALPQGTAELKQSPLRDKKVRQAINYAIDKRAITETLYRGYAEPVGQLAVRNSQSWDSTIQPVFDPGRARQLLAEAGYANGISQPLMIEVSRSQNLTDMLLVIQQQLKDVGITTEIEQIEAGLYSDRAYGRNNTQKADISASGNGDTNGFNTAIRVLQGCSRPVGGTPTALYWCNPDWDRLQDAAIAERDPTRRAQMLRDANAIMRDDAAVIPLFLPASFAIATPKIMGVATEGMSVFSLDPVYKIK